MKPFSKSLSPRLSCLSLAVACGWGGAATARACGPFFPNRYFDAPAARLLAAPQAFFEDELRRLSPAGPTPDSPRADTEETRPGPAERVAEVEAGELAAALRMAGRGEAETQALLAACRRARETGEGVPDGLPTEFAFYLRGALAWKRDDIATARAEWGRVLALPEAERRARSVWAAYMLGRSYLVLPSEADDEPGATRRAEAGEAERDEAEWWFRRTRELAAQGCADALGLAGEAKGWEARLLLEREDFGPAVRMYLERLSEGDETAAQSLRRSARRIADGAYGDKLERCVRDPQVREVVVAWLLSRGGASFSRDDGGDEGDASWPARARVWAMAIHGAGIREVRGADRLAWLAYEGGLFALAEDWLRLAPESSVEAGWLRGKLALRAGAMAEGARWLEQAASADALPEAHRRRILGELGRVRLAQDRPKDALAAWLAGDHWADLAYVAERVLTVDELAEVVDGLGEAEHGSLRHLLARRLARTGRGNRAIPYFPEHLREPYATYLADVRLGFEGERSAEVRAAAFWRAAKAMREQGMHLVGTELEPDAAIWDGDFETGSEAGRRLGLPALEGGVFAPTEQERARLEAHVVPGRRFHYRYRAAELGWWAASLSANDSEDTARMLWEAGGWLKAKDPKSAEPFYQALVIRCGSTGLGREAARLRWFPPGEQAADPDGAE